MNIIKKKSLKVHENIDFRVEKYKVVILIIKIIYQGTL